MDSSITVEHKLAVVMSVYGMDKPCYVKIAVDSILNQTYKYFHLFIGVDGPVGEDLFFLLQDIGGHEKVSIIWFSENRGLACVLNDLLDVCFNEGFEYVARMDADDISMADRLERQMSYLLANQEIDVVGGSICEIDEEGKSRDKTIIYPATPEGCRLFFAKRNPHAHPAVLFRRSFFDKLNGKKYRPEYRQNQDTMLWFDGLMAGTRHANIPDVVLSFRVTKAMFKNRRNGWVFARKQLKDRLRINRELGYGWKADIYGFAVFCMLVSPVWVKRIAYKLFR